MSSKHTEGLLRGVTNKDQKNEIRRMLKRGWSADTTASNHVVLVHETGASCQVPLTGGRNAARWTRKKAERALERARGGA